MKEKEYTCPYCKSKDVTYWTDKIKEGTTNIIKVYRCYNCGQFSDVRVITECGEQVFCHGDNHSVSEMEEHKKFKDMGLLPKAKKDDLINLWIDLWEFLEKKINGKNTN